jgi:HEAT repeat protein
MRATSTILGCVVLAVAVSACRAKEDKPDIPRLLAELRSSDPQASGQARLKLLQLGEPAVPALAEMLRSGTPAERVAAVNTLWGMGPRARAAVPDLVATLADPDPALRVAAAMALENMGDTAAPATQALAKAITDRDLRVRQAAVKALGAIGPPAAAAVPALTRVLRRGSWPEAEEAIRRIRGLQPGAPIELGPAEPEEP